MFRSPRLNSLRRAAASLIAQKIIGDAYAYKLLQIGRLTVIWAYVEGTLDVINETIGLIEAPNEPFPASLKQKVRFFRAAYRQRPELAELGPTALKIADQVTRLAKRRHDTIHGMLEHDPEKSSLRLTRHSYAKGRAWQAPRRTKVSFAPGELNAVCEAATELHQWLMELHGLTVRVIEAHRHNLSG